MVTANPHSTPSTTHGLKYWIAILVKSMIRYRLELFYVESAEYLQFQKSSVLISTFVGQTKIHLHTTYLCINYQCVQRNSKI